MADLIPWSNLLPTYNSPNQMAEQNANIQQSQAQTGLIGAQTGLVGQQTQAADIANQGAMTQLQMLRQALNGGMPDASAVPGATPATPGMTGNAPPPTSDGGTSSGHPSNYPSVEDMQAYTQQKVGPLPVQFTTAEQQWLQRMRSTGNPLLSAQADAFEQGRIKATQQENAKRQYQAQQGYAAASAIATAADSGADPFKVMQRFSPELAKGLADAHPDDFDTDAQGNITAKPQGKLDAAAYAKSGAANIYQYTGRESTMVNGQLIDKTSGKPVPGVDQVLTHLSTEERQKAYDAAVAPVTVKNSDGSESELPAWKASGAMGGTSYRSPYDMVAAADKAASTRTNTPNSPNTGTAGTAGATGSPIQSPLLAAPPSTDTAAVSPPASRSASGPAPSNTTSAQAPMLPGVNIDTLPKSPAPVSGRSPNVTEQATNDARKEGLKESMQQQAETTQSNVLLSQFQQKLNNVNPRDVGPGSDAYKALLNLQSAVTGKPSGDLVDMGVLDKFANQLGVQNVRSLLSGQKITNQEMMNFLTRASASTTQPLDVMRTIIAYQKANNDYDRMAATTKIAALSKGADPFKLGGAIDTASPRDAYVQQSMDKALGATPAPRPGQQSSGQGAQAPVRVNSRADAMALKPGTVFVTPDGRQLVR